MVVYRVKFQICNVFGYDGLNQMACTLKWDVCLLTNVTLRIISVRHKL